MSKLLNNVGTIKLLSMLVKPIKDTDAFKLGIVDERGNNLIKSNQFSTSEQKEAYTLLDRLVFNLKKLINRLPGGEKKAKNLLSAYLLIKETVEEISDEDLENDFMWINENIDSLISEDILMLAEEVAANSTSAGVSGINSNDVAVPKSKKSIIQKRYKIPTL